jgi:hypothetical protein
VKTKSSIWETKPKESDYSAAEKYLTLLFSPADANAITRNLKSANTEEYAAKDLLRASQTHLLDKENPHVRNELKKIKKGTKLSPVLVVRGDGRTGVTLTIADGHHRICASWYWDEDVPVACSIANVPSSKSNHGNRQTGR